ncbi:MAG TPA: hypothetical protein VJ890_21780 [Vineibacter sp.]|nr:hypothetical protein [Vineibacter sp.]
MNDPFWLRAVLAAVGPLVAAFVGTLGIGLFAAWITERAQRRRQDRELRAQIIVEMTQTASAIYLETQRYWRAIERENSSVERIATLRMSLDERYHASRVSGEALEMRLRIYFATDKPRLLWHATMDLLTVRYFQLIGLDTDALLDANAGPEHSGLTVEQLRNPKLLLDTYRAKLLEATRAVLAEPRAAAQGST